MKFSLKCIIILILLSYTGSHIKFTLAGNPSKGDVHVKPESDDFTLQGRLITPEIYLNHRSIDNPTAIILAKGELEEDTEEVLEEELIEERTDQPRESVKQIKEKPDYSNLPFIPYIILTGEYANLKEEKFQAELYPKRISNIPNDLAIIAKKNKKLVVMTTKKGNNRQYLIIQNDKAGLFERAIKYGKAIRFVFSPAALYNSCPVIELVDII